MRSRISPADLIFRRLSALERSRHELLYLFLEITTACNLDCLHCGSDCTRLPRDREIDTESWVRIIGSFAARYPRLAVVLTGGEPLLHPGLEPITGALASSGLRWGLVTNGTLATGRRIEELVAAGMKSITVSLDGPEEVHDRLRNRPGVFRKAIAAMREIASAPLEHADVVTCVTPWVADRLDETARIIMDTGIREWRLFRIFPAGRARAHNELFLSHRATEDLLDWIARSRRRYHRERLSISYACEGWVAQRQNRRIRDPLSTCRAGINIASILSDGTITGCPNNDRRFHVGNIADGHFDDLWEHGFARFRDRSWLADTSCAGCRLLRFCRGSSIHLWRDGEHRVGFCYPHRAEGDASG